METSVSIRSDGSLILSKGIRQNAKNAKKLNNAAHIQKSSRGVTRSTIGRLATTGRRNIRATRMNDSQTKIPRLSVTPSELAASVGVGRDMVFDAIRNGKLVARKAGARTTLIELEEAQRWLKALPACRRSDLAVTAAA